jgi:protein arginine kinase activator
MTFEEFQRSGKVGCNNCYDVLEDNLNPLIRRLQGSIEHNGKVPARLSKSISISREISRLKELLLKAVEKEEYEKAAEIRDKIKSLEVGLK